MIGDLKGQPHGDARSLSEPALDVDLAAMQMHQAFDDRQAKSGAVVAAIIGGASLEKCLAVTVEDTGVGIGESDLPRLRGFLPEFDSSSGMRLEGFEPPTNGLEGR